MVESVPTRHRLMTEGMRLFAQRGFHETSVGEIEAAAGLQPRRGALYKHFATKQALLEAAVRAHLKNTEHGAIEIGGIDFAKIARTDPSLLRPVLAGVGRWFLDQLDGMRDLTRLIEHDGERLAALTIEVKRDIIDLGYRTAADLIRAAATETVDADAIAVVLLGALVAQRRTAWTFGSPPLNVDDDRAVTAWTELALTTFESLSRSSTS